MATKAELVVMAGSTRVWERAQAARAKRTPPEVLAQLAYDTVANVQWAARRNPKLPKTLLDSLVEQLINRPSNLSFVILGNPSLSAENLRTVYSARESIQFTSVVREIFAHPNCPQEILHEGANAEHPYLRAYVAGNPSLPESIWDVVLSDPSPHVRVAAVRNKAIPSARIEHLARDESLNVLRAVAKKATGLAKATALAALANRSRALHTRQLLAGNSTDATLLDRLAMDANPSVRRQAMRNEHTREEARVAAALLS